VTRAVIYTRQSLDKTGEGAAVARQLEDCEKLAQLRGWTVVARESDNDTSAAGKRKRPGFDASLAAIADDRADAIISWALDRLTRNRRDAIRLIETCEKRDAVVALVRGSDIDMGTPAGRLVADVLGGAARFEIDQKSDRQKRQQQQAATMGKPSGGRRAFGYSSDGMAVVEDEAALVKAAYSDILQGASLKGIARAWNELGVTTTMGGTWRHDNVRTVLKNPRYAGLRSYKGEVVGKAVWPAVVDEDSHAAAVALLSLPERRTTITTVRKYLLPGLAYCWKCGSDVATGHTRHNKRVYVCRANKCISRKAEPVDELIEQVMIARLSRPDAIELLSTNSAPDIADLRAKSEAIRERLDNLAIGLEEGLLTLGAVRKSSERLKTELAGVEATIQDATHADVLTPLITAEDVAAAWTGCDLQQKRAAIDALMKITLLKPEVGTRMFDPATVQINWKTGL
jgi:site-specific DNA recombinase